MQVALHVLRVLVSAAIESYALTSFSCQHVEHDRLAPPVQALVEVEYRAHTYRHTYSTATFRKYQKDLIAATSINRRHLA